MVKWATGLIMRTVTGWEKETPARKVVEMKRWCSRKAKLHSRINASKKQNKKNKHGMWRTAGKEALMTKYGDFFSSISISFVLQCNWNLIRIAFKLNSNSNSTQINVNLNSPTRRRWNWTHFTRFVWKCQVWGTFPGIHLKRLVLHTRKEPFLWI